MPFAVHELSTSVRRDEYREQLELQLQDRPHNDNDTSEQNWEALKHCIVTAACRGNSWQRKGKETRMV